MTANHLNAINWRDEVLPQLNEHILSEHGAANCLQHTKQQCVNYCSSLGYDYVAYTGYFPLGDNKHEFDNFPESFVRTPSIGLKNLEHLIYRNCQDRTSPFSWNEIPSSSHKASLQLKQLLLEIEFNNIHNGICVPIHGAGAEQGIFMVAQNDKDKMARDDSQRLLQFCAMSTHEAIKTCNGHQMKGLSKIKALSPRERECLDWIAAGKTAWETAKIIGITESTVSFHVRNTIQKLNASNRAHAVAIAMACSLISNSPG